TIGRRRRDTAAEAEPQASFGRVGLWSRRMLFAGLSGSRRATRLIGKRQTPAAPSRRGRRRLVRLSRVADRPALVAAGPRAAGPTRRRATRTMRTRTAACLLVVMAVLAALLTWATVSIARRAMASSDAAGGGSLVIPPPKLAAGLPMRPGE